MAVAARAGAGVALLPSAMFSDALDDGSLVAPFAACIDTGRYWLTRLKTRAPGPAMRAFRDWLVGGCGWTPPLPRCGAEHSGVGFLQWPVLRPPFLAHRS